MFVKPKIKPDFVKILKKYEGVTVPEIYQATLEVNEEYEGNDGTR